MKQESNINTPAAEEGVTINLKKILLLCLKRWYWFAGSVALCVAAGILYIACAPIGYNVSSTLKLRMPQQSSMSNMLSSLDLPAAFDIGAGNTSLLESELYVMNSKGLMRRAIEELDIQTDYYKKFGLRNYEQYPYQNVKAVYPPLFTDTLLQEVSIKIKRRANDYRLKFKYGRKICERYTLKSLAEGLQTPVGKIAFVENGALEKGDVITIETLPMAGKVELLRERVSATAAKNSPDILTYSYVTGCPQKAIDLINKLTNLYSEETHKDKMQVAGITEQFIKKRLEAISKELGEAERHVEKYKRDNKLTNLSAEASLFIQSSGEYQKRQAELETQLNLVEYIEAHIADNANRHSLIPANLGITDPALQKLIEEYNATLLKRMRLLRTTNEGNPVITQIESQLALVKGNITQSISSVKEGIKISLADAAGKERELAGRLTDVPTQEREYIEIERLKRIKETVYVFLQQKLEENALSMMTAIPPLRIVDKAQTDPAIVSPRILAILLICVLAGGLLPACVILGLYFQRNAIDDAEDFKHAIAAPVAGYTAQMKDTQRLATAAQHTFGFLANNLLHCTEHKRDEGGMTMQVTSSIEGEGKTFVTKGLAIALARTGAKVAVVDLDTASPQQAAKWKMGGRDSLSAFLSDPSAPLTVCPTAVANVDLLPLGKATPDAEQWMANGQIEKLFGELRQRYDYILIDSSTIMQTPITLYINRYANMTLYVSRVDHTPRKYVATINDLYARQRLNNLMCVLNGTKDNEFIL